MNALKIGFLFSLAFLIGCGGERMVEFPLPTSIIPDTTRPCVVSVSPYENATQVPFDTNVTARFSESVNPATLIFTLQKPNGDNVSANVTLTENGTLAILNPTNDLEPLTTYTAIVSGAKDFAGNLLCENRVWSFTTKSPTDTQCPNASPVTPRENADNIPVTTQIIVHFDEPVKPETIFDLTAILYDDDSDTKIPVAFSLINGATDLVLDPIENLGFDKIYKVRITSDITDPAGNHLCAPLMWRFRTEVEPDTQCPYVYRVIPSENTSGVRRDIEIIVEFNEIMNLGTINASSFKVKSGGTDILGSISFSSAENHTSAIFHPTNNLAPNTTYTVYVTALAKDLSENSLCNGFTSNFTTGSLPDTECPSATPLNPANGATQVPFDTNVTARFSESVNPATLIFTLQKPNGDNVSANVTLTENGTLAILDPTNDLEPLTTYTVIITSANDLAGNVLCESLFWIFTTGERPDNERPRVISTYPVGGAIDVELRPELLAVFSENMAQETVNRKTFLLREMSSDPADSVSGTVFANGNTARFIPNYDLKPNTRYEARIRYSVEDLAGNNMAADYLWIFQIGNAPDHECPHITSFNPTRNATGVPVGTSITVRFDEPVAPESVTPESFYVSQGSVKISAAILFSENNSVLTLRPTNSLFYATAYTVTLTNAITDPSGNHLCNPEIWSFTTEEAPDHDRPYVTQTDPQDGAVNVSISKEQITATFSETMDPQSFTAGSFSVRRNDGAAISGSVSVNGNAAIFWLSQSLTSARHYTATIESSVTDLAGNEMLADYTWDFMTEDTSDHECPSVRSVTPIEDATGIAFDTNVTAKFNEKINPATLVFVLKNLNEDIIPGAITWTEQGTRAVLNPNTNLAPLTIYTAWVTSADDLAGNHICQSKIWSFTTSDSPDEECPRINSFTPQEGATNVPRGTNIVVFLSEGIDRATVTANSFYLALQNNTRITGIISFSGDNKTLTLNPVNDLAPSTRYTATLTNAVKDPVGNELCNPQSWSFTTEVLPDGDCPRVESQSVEPPNNAHDVPLDTKPKLRFSESMDPATVTVNSFFLEKPNGDAVSGSVTMSANNTIATFDPLGNLDPATNYTLRVTRDAKDPAGNRLCVEFVSIFTTGSEPVSPLPLYLASAAPYAVLAAVVHNSGATVIYGFLGTSPGTDITGFPPGNVVNGETHAGDAYSLQAWYDLRTAYNDAAGRSANVIILDGELGGLTLPTGLYRATSFGITTSDLTLDARGDQNAVWIFQVPSGTLTLGVNRRIVLANGAKAANVFWAVGNSATLGTNSVFKGNILANQSITLSTGVTVSGRVLSKGGVVILNTNTIIRP